jgi:hypothetical protein
MGSWLLGTTWTCARTEFSEAACYLVDQIAE